MDHILVQAGAAPHPSLPIPSIGFCTPSMVCKGLLGPVGDVLELDGSDGCTTL